MTSQLPPRVRFEVPDRIWSFRQVYMCILYSHKKAKLVSFQIRLGIFIWSEEFLLDGDIDIIFACNDKSKFFRTK